MSSPPFSPVRAAAVRKRVLVVEDDPNVRDYLEMLLTREGGYEVEALPDGHAAFARVLTRPPDLVLSDVLMPSMDGITLLQRLRAEPSLAGLPIILITGRVDESMQTDALAAGADDYLYKPFRDQELLARIRGRLLQAHRRRPGARREEG